MAMVNDKRSAADAARRRIAWQCRRGMRELDELLGGYLESQDERLDVQEIESLEKLLAYPDAVLLELLMGRMQAADKDVEYIVREIRNASHH